MTNIAITELQALLRDHPSLRGVDGRQGHANNVPQLFTLSLSKPRHPTLLAFLRCNGHGTALGLTMSTNRDVNDMKDGWVADMAFEDFRGGFIELIVNNTAQHCVHCAADTVLGYITTESPATC